MADDHQVQNEKKVEIIIPDEEIIKDLKLKTESKQDHIILSSSILPERLFILPVVGKPIFPGMVFPIFTRDEYTVKLVRTVVKNLPQKVVGFVLTKREETAQQTEDAEIIRRELYVHGTGARILDYREDENSGEVRVVFQGEKRFKILNSFEYEGLLAAQVVYFDDIFLPSDETKALTLAIMNTLRDLTKHNPLFNEEIRMFLSRGDFGHPGRLADFAASMTSASREELQDILACQDVKVRMEKVLLLLRKELDLNQLKEKITQQIEEKINKHQREFFLREQLKAIKKELGLEKEEKEGELERYEKALQELPFNEEARNRVIEEMEKIKVLNPQSPEYSVSRNYLDWIIALPWGKYTEDQLDVQKARTILDERHYGLKDVKERILEFIAVAKLKGTVTGSILCLIGPPGVGKTSLGQSIADALGRKFFRFSLGGMRDEAEIKGHRRTYIGALPGKFMQALRSVGSANPVIMLDEIDKIGASYHGDPASALLEVLDPEQNASFRDHYLDIPFDLSKVLFIATANVPDTIPAPLYDRMEIIQIPGYILEEKLQIATRHLIPRLIEKHGLPAGSVRFTIPALRKIIHDFAREAGVRSLEKSIGQCLRKIATGVAEQRIKLPFTIQPSKVHKLLGKPRFFDDPLITQRKPGIATGLAWTPVGGSVLFVEVIAMNGQSGTITLTGQLGDVMKESSHIAFSYVRSQAKNFGLSEDILEKQHLHIHVPAGATPKDGPSAGITIASAIVSLASGKPVPSDWAMTGELTLTGRVLPVGGIKEKLLAAKRANISNIILPKLNERDVSEIPAEILNGLKIYYVEEYPQVYHLIFQPSQ